MEKLEQIGTPELLANSQMVQDEVKLLREEVHNLREEYNAQLKKISDYERRGFFAKLFGSKS